MALPLIKRLGTVFAVALALRVAASLWLNLAPAWMQPTFFVVTADSATYREAALGILAGQGYRLSGSEEAASSVAPLFSYFLAGVYATVGSSPLTVSLVHSLIDAGTAVLLVLIVGTCFARRDGPTDVGFLAGMIYAVFPFSVFCAPRVLKEALAVFLTVLSAGLWIRLLRCTSWNAARGWSLASGLALGLGTLMRFFNGILFLTVVACDVALVARRARGPWLLRQERLFGSMVLSTHGPMRYLDNEVARTRLELVTMMMERAESNDLLPECLTQLQAAIKLLNPLGAGAELARARELMKRAVAMKKGTG